MHAVNFYPFPADLLIPTALRAAVKNNQPAITCAQALTVSGQLRFAIATGLGAVIQFQFNGVVLARILHIQVQALAPGGEFAGDVGAAIDDAVEEQSSCGRDALQATLTLGRKS